MSNVVTITIKKIVTVTYIKVVLEADPDTYEEQFEGSSASKAYRNDFLKHYKVADSKSMVRTLFSTSKWKNSRIHKDIRKHWNRGNPKIAEVLEAIEQELES